MNTNDLNEKFDEISQRLELLEAAVADSSETRSL